MARDIIKVEGLKDLDAALVALADEFHPRNARSVLRGALKDGGKIIADAGEVFAPRLSGELADSYTVGSKLSRRQKKLHNKESQIEVFVGPTPHAKSVQTEFGNAHQAPHPHLRPAWDGNWRSVLDLIVDRAKERLEKTRKRLARKAERDAAKMAAGN
jgi:hypothetical protein